MKAGASSPGMSDVLFANPETLGVVGAPSRMPTSWELRLSVQSGLVKPPGEVVEGCPGGRAIPDHWL
jgi:hypothetical protein